MQFNAKKERFEIKIAKPVKLRGNTEYRNFEYFVTGDHDIKVLHKYQAKINAAHCQPNSQFLKNYNIKSQTFVQNCGKETLNKIPKEVAKRLGKTDWQAYGGQS